MQVHVAPQVLRYLSTAGACWQREVEKMEPEAAMESEQVLENEQEMAHEQEIEWENGWENEWESRQHGDLESEEHYEAAHGDQNALEAEV